ncbi:NADPH dehydrogenase [Oligella ureolytica]|uniref:NADH:flavin oxidoreductase/NADH oxidase n=1 Tax=Oligella ureolytica TaxID=90244 RepID=UPI000E05055C|nr:NADH:flavin oxidoreductase/NADH oxidase [Oligella ureolytica]SUA54592.1 NADPH dehydrogenase [Oligella ureolytica]
MNNNKGLLDNYKIRDLTLKNRIVLSPMTMYAANNGYITPFLRSHYNQFAIGGTGLIIIEQTAVSRNGRITNGDLGLWEDNQIKDLASLISEIKSHGSAVGIQLNHGGRKSSQQRAFHGNGPLNDLDLAAGEEQWQPLAPSAIPLAEGWLLPQELSHEGLKGIKLAFSKAAERAVAAGVDMIELHMAHGYLLQTFLTPLANKRTDEYGGSLDNRMRFPLQVARQVRKVIPDNIPLFVRISASDWIEGGWTLEESLIFCLRLKELGVDLIDCSSGGNLKAGATNSNLVRAPGFQVHFAETIRKKVAIPTAAVGLIRTPEFANQIITDGKADLVCIGRQMLFNPFWAHHAAYSLNKNQNPNYENWPEQYGWWLEKWDASLRNNNENAMSAEVLKTTDGL